MSKPTIFGSDDYEYILLAHAGWIKVEKIELYPSRGFIWLLSDKKELCFHVDSLIAIKKKHEE